MFFSTLPRLSLLLVSSAILLFLVSCRPPPREGTPEWLARKYSEALLQSNTEVMRRYVASGLQIRDAERNPYTASLHVIRLCPRSQSTEERKKYLVLFGGRLDGAVYGLEMELIKEEVGWRVRDTQLSRNSKDVPILYLRNCGLDTSGETPRLSQDLPSPTLGP